VGEGTEDSDRNIFIIVIIIVYYVKSLPRYKKHFSTHIKIKKR